MFSIVTRSPADLAPRSNARQAGGRRYGLGDAGGIGIIKQIPKLLQVAEKGRLVPFRRLVGRLRTFRSSTPDSRAGRQLGSPNSVPLSVGTPEAGTQ